MNKIYLTLYIDGRQSAAQLRSIAEWTSEHLTAAYKGVGILKKVSWHAPDPKKGLDLKRRVIAELSAWYEECEDIADAVSTTEDVVSYTERMTRIKALIKEVKKS